MAFFDGSYDIYLAILAAACSVLWYTTTNRKKYNYPPGPKAYPIIGILPHIYGGCMGRNVTNLAQKYGNVFGGWIGRKYVVFISDYDLIKEVQGRKDDVFSDRPPLVITETLGQLSGVASATIDNNWKEHRRFTMRVLKNMGMGRPNGKITSQTLVEARALVTKFGKMKGPFNPAVFMGMAACNIATWIMFGQRYDFDDAEFLETFKSIEYIVGHADTLGVIGYFPILKYIPYGSYRSGQYRMRFMEKTIHGRIINERVKNFDPNKEPQDLIDAYLMEIHEDKMSGNTDIYKKEQLISVCSDMLVAGTDTTSTFEKWLLLYSTKFVDKQRKIQEELDAVIGRDRYPTLADKPNIPYTYAFTAEVMRHAVFGLFAVPHSAYCDTKIYDFDIPKGAFIMTNVTAMLKDPKVFPDPETFMPERFIDSNGKIINALIERTQCQFGVGRRACAGKDVGWFEGFMYLANLLQAFTLSGPNGPDAVNIVPDGSLARKPVPYKLVATPRY